MRATLPYWHGQITRRGTVRQRKPRTVSKSSDAEYILSRIQHDTAGGCWLWSGPINRGGYGITTRGLAHRVAYRAFIGDAEGALVCHSCDVRCCVNPAHLWLGNHKDNADDMVRKNRSPWASKKPDHLRFWQDGEANPNSKLNRLSADEIRRSPLSKIELAGRYGVSISTVNRIKAGSIWRA